MTKGQCAILSAFLGAIAVGVFIAAYNSDVTALTGGRLITQHVIPYCVLGGTVGGLLLGWLFSPTGKPAEPTTSIKPF